MKNLILAFALTILACSTSMAVQTIVSLPEGAAKGLVIIAPAKKYLMHERLFAVLAGNLAKDGYIAVRFNWSEITLSESSLELERAAADIKTVTIDAQKEYGFSPEKTVIIAKSFSTKALDQNIDLAKTFVLLTPNCSDELPFEKTYSTLLNKPDINLAIAISNEDPYCKIHQIHQTLATSVNLPSLFTSYGDHNFVITPNIFKHQDQAIEFVTNFLK